MKEHPMSDEKPHSTNNDPAAPENQPDPSQMELESLVDYIREVCKRITSGPAVAEDPRRLALAVLAFLPPE
jgi:hypothetical protein